MFTAMQELPLITKICDLAIAVSYTIITIGLLVLLSTENVEFIHLQGVKTKRIIKHAIYSSALFIFTCGMTHAVRFADVFSSFPVGTMIFLLICAFFSVYTTIFMIFSTPFLMDTLKSIEISANSSAETVHMCYNALSEMITLHDFKSFKISFNNTSAIQFGHKNLVGRSFIDLVHPEYHNNVESMFQDALKNIDRSIIYQLRTAKGDYVYVESCCVRTDMSGMPKLLTCTRNIQYRMNVFDTKVMQISNQIKTETNKIHAMSLAHDIRTPLSVFEMSIQNNDLKSAQTTLDYLIYLIDRTIESCRILQNERPVPDFQSVSVNDVIKTVKVLLHTYPRSVPVVFDLDTELYMKCWCDYNWLVSILVSYLTNALDNTMFGKIVCNVRYSENDTIKFSVIDTGNGILAQDIPNLFRPFVKLHNKQFQEHGLGIGLFNCAWRTRFMNGIYGMQENPDGGSIFYSQLPTKQHLPPAISPSAKRPSLQDQMSKQIKILIVEDTVMIRRLMVIQLKKKGYIDISEAEDGAQGLNMLKTSHYDVAIVDMYMPVLNGKDVIDEYNAWCKYTGRKLTKFIMMSADSLDQSIRGSYTFLQKPVKMDKLIALF